MFPKFNGNSFDSSFMEITGNLSVALVENSGEHNPIRKPLIGNMMVCARFMETHPEEHRPRISEKVGTFTPEFFGPGLSASFRQV